MLVFLFLIASVTIALPVSTAALNCTACQLDNSFTELNGYGCFELVNGDVACTCPDRRYTLNTPCRICDRENICGTDPENFCSEISLNSLGVQNNSTEYFACFCSDQSYYFGEPCPPTPSNNTSSTD